MMEPRPRAEVTAHLEEPQYAFSLNLFAEDSPADEAVSEQDQDICDDTAPTPSAASPPNPTPPKQIELKIPTQPQARVPTLMANAHRGQKARLSNVQSAPMLPAVFSPHVPAMYVTRSTAWRPSGELTLSVSSSSRSCSTQEFLSSKSKVAPLGSAWREGDVSADGEAVRSNPDEGGEYIHGCVPNWGRERAVRSVAAVEQKLSWTYYRMRGLRAAVPQPPPTSKERSQRFDFWTDLRPPMRVEGMERDPEDNDSHPDGLLFRIFYTCPLDYVTERKWGRRTSEGTFDNVACGTAEVRIPKDFPQNSKQLCVLSWGAPTLKSKKSLRPRDPVTVDPSSWSPITSEMQSRSQSRRFNQLQQALQRANTKLAAAPKKTRHWQKALLSHSATLADFMKAEQAHMDEEQPPPRMRDLRIRTACAGFVDIQG
ncbi:unnamed protein product [Symbiodinium natans]|uniref:Uncharacterized protein n=1 Tax=Symbiodinium natans TaxID=878477 RepID=A0A812HPJ6_9DINO|nr:unnamed protein product [Symbiodinium natans]